MSALRPWIVAAALLTMASAVASAADEAEEEAGGAPAGSPAPDFTLSDLTGGQVRLSDLVANGPVVMAFWASWCRPCALEVPHLSAMQEELGGRGLTVIGVSLDDATTVGDVRAFVRTKGVRYTVLLDIEGRVAALYNPEHALPLTVLIGRGGRVRQVHRGYAPGDEVGLREEVLDLLDEAAPTDPEAAKGVVWSASALTLLERDVGKDSKRTAGFVRPRVDATWGRMSAGVRYDIEAVRRPLSNGEGDYSPCLRGRIGLSYLEYGGDRVRARAGDSHVVLGRGLLLHLNQVGAFGVETSVLGAEAEASAGPVSARVFGGVTHFSETPQTLQGRCTEIYNPIAGGRVEGRIGPVILGAHALRTAREDGAPDEDGFPKFDSDPDAEGLSGAGLTLEVTAPDGGPHLYIEAVTVRSEGASSRQSGRGTYGSLAAPMGPMTVTLEFKRYDALDLTYQKYEPKGRFTAFMPYNVPPTLQPSSLVFETQPDLVDSKGARLRIDADMGADVSASGSLFQGSEVDDVLISHPIFGVEYEPEGLRISLEGGVRTEKRPGKPSLEGVWRHSTAEAVVQVSGPHSMNLIANYKAFSPDRDEFPSKTDLQFVAAYLHPRVEAAVVLETRQPPPPESRGFYPDVGDVERFSFHPSASATWRFSSSGALTAFVGSDPGGLRCTSGVCRILPAFEGGRLEASMRF